MKRVSRLIPIVSLALTVACTEQHHLVEVEAPAVALSAAITSPAHASGASLGDLVGLAQAHGVEQGAMFIEDALGNAFIFFAPFPTFCGIGPLSPGNGSFYRQNPDGTVTAKLSGTGAPIGSGDLFTGLSYSGEGNAQVHMTGQAIIIPLPTGRLVFLQPPFRGEAVFQAVGNVVQDGTIGPSQRLRCRLQLNSDGSTKRSEIVLR